MKYLPIVAICALLFILLAVRFGMVVHTQVHFQDGQTLMIRSQLSSEPTISGRMQRFSVSKQGFDTVYISTSIFPQYHYGDKLQISGTLKKKVLDDSRQIMTLEYPQIKQLPTGFSPLIQLKRAISHLFLSTLPAPAGSLLLGIVFGSKEAMPKQFLDQLQLEGLTHVIAASGMNVSMVAAALLFICSLFLKRRLAIATAMLGIVGYCLLTGLEPSIVRASLMSLLGCSALLLGRQQWGFLTIALTAYVMVFLSPLVIFDLGFQLSFLSTLGIMYIKPTIDQLWHKLPENKVTSFFAEDLTTTTAAQLATLPVLLITFGTYNLLAVIPNMLLLWTIPFLMILGAIAAICGLVLPAAGHLLLFVSLPLLIYFQTAVELASHISLQLSFSELPWLLVTGYYGLLISWCLFARHEKVVDH